MPVGIGLDGEDLAASPGPPKRGGAGTPFQDDFVTQIPFPDFGKRPGGEPRLNFSSCRIDLLARLQPAHGPLTGIRHCRQDVLTDHLWTDLVEGRAHIHAAWPQPVAIAAIAGQAGPLDDADAGPVAIKMTPERGTGQHDAWLAQGAAEMQ